MSTPDTPTATPGRSPVMKIVAAAAAVAVLAFGASAISKHGTSSSSAAPGGQGAPQGFAPQGGGQGAPRGGPGMFSPVTGTTLAKLKSVATAKYPGTVERAVKLPDGSYEVHVIQSSGQEVHVRVSKGFTVTGTGRRDFRGGPAAGQVPGDQAAPSGTQS